MLNTRSSEELLHRNLEMHKESIVNDDKPMSKRERARLV